MSDRPSDASLRRVALSTGVELDVLDVGPREAPALIFLHGFPESHRAWRHQVDHFAGLYRCIAPDQRGYRGSSKPAGAKDYRSQRMVADTMALADACRLDRFAVIGHDWGGAIAWGVAVAAGPRLEALVIVNAPHPLVYQRLLLADAGQRAAAQYVRLFRDRAHDALIGREGLGGLLRLAFGWGSPLDPDPADAGRQAEAWADPGTATAMLNWYRASPLVVPEPDEDCAGQLAAFDVPYPKVAAPTLVVWGTADRALLLANLDGLEAFADPLRIVRLPDVGHFVPWQAPDALNAQLGRFLCDHAASPAGASIDYPA